MPSNAQKLHYAERLDASVRKKIADAIQLTGKALPAFVISVSGSIVKVAFNVSSVYTLPQVTCTLAGSEYIRLPIQPGCKGVVFPSDTAIDSVTGLGSAGPADLVQPANLAALTFFPVGNKNWSPPDDPDALIGYGPNGVILRDSGKNTTLSLTPEGLTIEDVNGNVMAFNSDGITINGVTFPIGGSGSYPMHQHSGVTTGSGDTGPVA